MIPKDHKNEGGLVLEWLVLQIIVYCLIIIIIFKILL